jgi:hypothetical protein
MAQVTGAANGAAQHPRRSAVRPSWSYEIVAMEEQQDTGRVTESNILDTSRRRNRSRQEKATDTEMAAEGQASMKALAANLMCVDVNSVKVPDKIHGRPSAEQPRDNNVASIMNCKEQEIGLEGILKQRAEKLPLGFIHDQQLQHAVSPLGNVRGPQAGVSPITQPPNGLSNGRDWEKAPPTIPTADQMQEVNSTQESTLRKSNHLALPQILSSDDVLPAKNTLASRPHVFERLLNGSTTNLLHNTQTPEPSRWTLTNLSTSDSALHSDHSTYNARSSKQAIFEGRALKPSKTPTSRYIVLTDEPTPSSPLDTAVSAISPVVFEIEA